MAYRSDEGWRWDPDWHVKPTIHTITVQEPEAQDASQRAPFGFSIHEPQPDAPDAEWHGNPS